MYTTYKNNICYVKPDNKLVLATMKDYVFDTTPIEIDIADSVLKLLLVKNNLVIHTSHDDIYVYDIITNKSQYLGKYYLKILTRYNMGGQVHFILATTSHVELLDESFIKMASFEIPDDEYLEKVHYFFVRPNMMHYVTTNIKTYILSSDLNCVAVLANKYSSIYATMNIIFGLTSDGNSFNDLPSGSTHAERDGEIHVYDSDWIFVMTLDIGEKIKSITIKRSIVYFVDVYDRYYIFRENDTNFNDTPVLKKHMVFTICDNSCAIYKLYPEHQIHRVMNNCRHIHGCCCNSKLEFIFRTDLLVIHDLVGKKSYHVNIENYHDIMTNIESCHIINDDVLIIVDKFGNIFLYQITRSNNCFDFFILRHELEFKIKKKINMKSSNFLM